MTAPPSITVTIYRVDSHTGERSPAVRRTLVGNTLPTTAAWPPCTCPRCRTGPTDRPD